MPLIRVSLPEGITNEKKAQIRKRIKNAVLKTLAPKEIKYDYVSIISAHGEIGDGLPVVDIDLRPGRETERKKKLVDQISIILKEILNIEPEDVYCIFREISAENHYTGGKPLPLWVASDKWFSTLFVTTYLKDGKY